MKTKVNKKSDGLISVEDAISNVLLACSTLNSEELNIADAFGRILAKDLVSRVTQPPLAVSAMDGYAVRVVDVLSAPVKLRKIGESSAGSGFSGSVGEGETVRIFTGAPVPDGADAIVIQEEADNNDNLITIGRSVKPGQFVRSKGLDFREGQTLLSAGTPLNSRHVALASGMNVPWVSVIRKPCVAILSTGNELVLPGEPMGPGQIVSSNSIGLTAFVNGAGGVGINLGIAKDNFASISDLLAGIEGADMLVTIGGASVGEYDLVETVLGDKGLDVTFSRVAMRPGKPLIFGKIGGKPMLGLNIAYKPTS